MLACALLLGANVACAQDAAPVVVPFDLLVTQHMVVSVKINGKGPYRLIFDTGAPITLINNKTARDSAIIGANVNTSPFALFGGAGEYKIKSMEVGDLKVADLTTIVMDHPTLTAIAKALGPVEGIVGFSFFARYRMTLDYQAKTMTFVPNGFNPPNIIENLPKILMSASSDAPKIISRPGVIGMQVEKKEKDAEPGVNVTHVFAESAAATAGLKEGDRLLTIDDRWTDSVLDTHAAVARLQPGRTVQAVVTREGKKLDLKLKVAAGL